MEIDQILQERERKRREKRAEKIRNLKQKLGKLEFKTPAFDEHLIKKRSLRLDKLKILKTQIDENYLKFKQILDSLTEFVKIDDAFLEKLNDLDARDAF